MTQQMPIPLHLAFVPVDSPTFSYLIAKLPQQGRLSATRRRDMISGLKRVATALGLPPSEVPCDGRWLQPRLARISPAMIGLKPKSWQNAVSDARAAMAHFGIVERRSRLTAELDRRWRPLWESVLASGDPTLPPALRRFVHFLNRMGVAPEDVRQDHAEAFLAALTINEICKDPEVAYRAAVNGWNLAGCRLPQWPDAALTLPNRQVRIALDADAFPASFMADLDALLTRLAEPDPFAEDDPSRALRSATLKQYRYQLLRFASDVVHAGTPPEEITALAFLLDPVVAERGLRQMLARNENKTNRGIAQAAALLRNLARILALSDETRDALARLAKKVALAPQHGMTAKNRGRLRVLQEPKHRSRVFELPDRIFAMSVGSDQPARKALAREDALAIAILLYCPIRAKNLAELRLDLHVQRPGDGRVFLVLEDQDTKTGRPIEFELPREVVKLLDKNLATRSPHRCPSGTPFLFPQRSGRKSVEPSVLGTRIAKRIHRETGLEMNAHLFRHFAVMNWLDANPGGYEVARRLLGHSNLSHTINLYSGMEIKSATKAFSDLIAGLKDAKK